MHINCKGTGHLKLDRRRWPVDAETAEWLFTDVVSVLMPVRLIVITDMWEGGRREGG